MIEQTVPVTLPTEVWWMLSELAEKRSGRVADEIADAIRERVEAGRVAWKDHHLPTRDRVAARVRAGWSDRTIAAHLLVSVSTVQQHRQRAGLVANREARRD